MGQLIFPITKKEAEKSGVAYSSQANKDALFPSRLRKLREEKGVSQAVLSAMLGVSKSTVGLWETGDTLPDARALYDMANYFGVSVDYMLCRSNVKNIAADIQAAAKCTGLSEIVIDWLQSINCDSMRLETLEMLNAILGNKTFQALLPFVNELKNAQIAAEIDRWSDDADYIPTQQIGNGKYVVGGYEYLSVLEYRIAECFRMVINDITLKSLDNIGG